jgi:major type 1 subunit fimbrin (pilin)
LQLQTNLKKISLIASLGALAATAQFAHAADGQSTVKFSGELKDETCQIDAGDLDKTVTLPTVSTKTLAASGDVAGSTMFTIKVSNCPSTLTKVAAHFETDNMDEATHGAKNLAQDNPAANVVVQIIDKDGTTALGLGTKGSAVDLTASGDTKSATLNYGGRYLATGATTQGKVAATVKYTLAYN